jgi:hypothetical protein
MYQFTTLDPRNIPAAIEANDKVFAGSVYGIEVTVPALAKRCTFNLDPQHSGGDANRAAIEDSLTAELPAEGSTLATVRADLDAVGSMAIFNLRAKGESLESAMGRTALVATADKFARGGYSGPKPLPTRDNPWDESSATAESSRPLAAIASAIMDFKVPMADRVSTMERWLLTGDEPKQYRTQVEKERLDMITALKNGAIKYEVHYFGWCAPCNCNFTMTGQFPSLCPQCGGADTRGIGSIAVIESTHRAATSVGYSLAPVVIALNPAFKLGGGKAHKKFTICAFEAKFADIKSALAELATLEAGWGGSPVIGGSPQGVSSVLTIDQVAEVVAKHLR